MATNFGLKFYETSAKTNINIQKIFYDMAKDLTAKVINLSTKYIWDCFNVKIIVGRGEETNSGRKY